MIYNSNGLKYALEKSDRKTLSIYVERDGEVLVRAPKTISHEQLHSILDQKKYWIYKSKAELRELNSSKIKREIANGEGFLFLGRSYRLKIEEKSKLKYPLSLQNGYFLLREDALEHAREHFITFYKRNGKEHIKDRVQFHKKKFALDPKDIRVIDLRNRWASRTRNGLNFHWKVALAPMTVIDYIVVHELAHYLKTDHSPAFWELVESVIPDYQKRKSWLRIYGASLDV